MAANYYKYNANMNDRTYFTSVISDSAGNAKRYFSNVESEIYFGDHEMDDLYQFEFGIDEKMLPIYGYNCYYASELVSGQRIVQGQFVVNYTDSKLIQSTLNSIEDSVYKESYKNEKYVPGGDLHHAIYDKEFDIMIGYGYYDIKDRQTYNATSQTILGAKISGMHKVMDTTGQPILEVYSFIAKDFIEENITEATTGNGSNNNSSNNNNNNTPTFKFSYLCSDAYNSSEIEKNDKYVSQHSDCEHFIHNIVYTKSCISMSVTTSNGKDITLVSASIEITDNLNDDINFPRIKFDSVSKTSATASIESKYAKVLNQKVKEGVHSVNCTIRYKLKIANKSNLIKEFTVVYQNATLYL